MKTQAQQRPKLTVSFPWMIRRHMPEVLAIEASCFQFPWSREDFVDCLRNRNCIGVCAEWNDQIVGFMIYELHRGRLHILNFAVDPQYWRRGIGRQLVDKLKMKLSPDLRNKIRLHVRETNLAAQLFFRAQGFRAVSLLRDFYGDPGASDLAVWGQNGRNLNKRPARKSFRKNSKIRPPRTIDTM